VAETHWPPPARLRILGRGEDYEELEPLGDPLALAPLGWAYEKLGRVAEAEKVLLACYEMRLHDEVVNDLGNLYSEQGKLDQAEALYRQALADGDESVLLNLGNVVAEQGDSPRIWRRRASTGTGTGTKPIC
jgi:tetratricopeptide (TPR) repeat protein